HITEFNPNTANLIAAAPIRYDQDLARRVGEIPGVTRVIPYAVRPAILQANRSMEGIKLKGVDSSFRLSPKVSYQGRPMNFADTAYSREIVLSEATASRLQITTGDELMLYFLEPGAAAPRIRK